MGTLLLFLKGMAMGGANVVPGISGATLAVIFRIYDRLIDAVNRLFSDFRGSLKFLLPVSIGMVFGVLTVGVGVNFFLGRFSMQTGGFIAGLVSGSIPFIYSQAKIQPIGNSNRLNPAKYYAIAVATAAAIILIAVLTRENGENGEYAADAVLSAGILHLFAGGLFAAAVMVVPGISGGLIFVLFGLLGLITHTIDLIFVYLRSPTDFEILAEIFAVAVPLGLGIIAGVLLGSKLIAWLLKKFYSATYFAILGLVFGTIFVIFNAPETYQSHDEITVGLVALTAVMFVLGAAMSLILGRKKD